MGFVAGNSHLPTTTTAPHHAGSKRPYSQLTTTLSHYGPSAASQRMANPATPRALVPFLPSSGEPIAAIPLSSAAPDVVRAEPPRPRSQQLSIYNPSAADQQSEDAGALVPFVPSGARMNAASKSKKPKIAPDVVRDEPPWLRKGLLPYLGLHRSDLPVHFIAEKTVTATDLDRHQHRFHLPSEAVLRNLLPVLSTLERKAANLLDEDAPRPPRLPKQPKVPGEKRAKRPGKKHGGLPVLVIEPNAGIRELQLSRWDSSGVIVVKGEGYPGFIDNCGFKEDDVVEIWAFKERYFRLFGVDLCQESPLFLLITKKV
jgi:hypothetical protein